MSAVAEISTSDDLQDKMRTTLLAHFRISRAELDVLRNELDLIGTALRNHLLTPHQAMRLVYERDVMGWLFRERGDAA
ncbi:MAG: hypothetical protein IIB62_11840 [Proteobacteria bacterium]|nr:hypothetical protein [Pseudomonadota bacterium]